MRMCRCDAGTEDAEGSGVITEEIVLCMAILGAPAAVIAALEGWKKTAAVIGIAACGPFVVHVWRMALGL